ncbi:MAG: NAD(P)H-dependent oxidoreductase subunit E [Bacteroidales bacterium]
MNSKFKIVICLGSSCYNRGNQQVLEVIKKYLNDNNLKDKVDFRGQLCSGNCAQGPVLHINDKTYKEIDENIAIRLLDEFFGKN